MVLGLGLVAEFLGIRALDSSFSGSNIHPPFRTIDILEKMKLIFSDVDTEGKKLGYVRAAAEYISIIESLEKETKEIKFLLESEKEECNETIRILAVHLENLENQENDLKEKHTCEERKVEHAAQTKNAGRSIGHSAIGPSGPSLIDVVYQYRKNQMDKAEAAGYSEAKKIFKDKIKELKDNLSKLKEKGEGEIQKLLLLIDKAIDSIAQKSIEIADLMAVQD